MTDSATNTAHARHYVDAAAQNHATIVRLRAELTKARARIAYLEEHVA